MYSTALNAAQCATIEAIKRWVTECTRSRDELAGQQEAIQPSLYWQFFARAFDYVRSLPSEQFANLRLHTYHLDGDTYQSTFFSSPTRFKSRYTSLIQNIPERFRISAPRNCGEYGHEIDGSIVNESVLRWQELIRALLKHGVFDPLIAMERPVLLEIGGGYGALAHHLQGILNSVLYVIVDIPETLLYSASYLTILHGTDRVVLWGDPSAPPPDRIENASFLLVPNHFLASVSNLRFDLSLNIQSFQEMTSQQVADYLEFLKPRTRLLVSDNQDRQDKNAQELCVSDLLRRAFDLEHLRRGLLKSTATYLKRSLTGLVSKCPYTPLKRFLGTPKK